MNEPIFNVRNAVCVGLLVAIMSGLAWGLRTLSANMEFSSYMLFCGVAVAVMIAGGFIYDVIERSRSQQ